MLMALRFEPSTEVLSQRQSETEKTSNTGEEVIVRCEMNQEDIKSRVRSWSWRKNVGSNPGRDTCVLEQDT